MTEVRRYEGKVVLITGAASGFGRRAAERFAAEGASLVLGDIQEAGLAETQRLAEAAGAKVVTRVTDVGNGEAVRPWSPPAPTPSAASTLPSTMPASPMPR